MLSFTEPEKTHGVWGDYDSIPSSDIFPPDSGSSPIIVVNKEDLPLPTGPVMITRLF